MPRRPTPSIPTGETSPLNQPVPSRARATVSGSAVLRPKALSRWQVLQRQVSAKVGDPPGSNSSPAMSLALMILLPTLMSLSLLGLVLGLGLALNRFSLVPWVLSPFPFFGLCMLVSRMRTSGASSNRQK